VQKRRAENGFGPGSLRRDNMENTRIGAQYIIPGFEFGDLGVPNIPSFVADYYDPGSVLTFYWFKHHIM